MCVCVCGFLHSEWGVFHVYLDDADLQFAQHYPLGSSEVKMLHCTTFYAGEHVDEASVEEYTGRDVYRQSNGKSFSLEVTGVVLTPRTVCARVELAGDQLLLHCADPPRSTPSDTDMACGMASQDTCKRHPEVDSRLKYTCYKRLLHCFVCSYKHIFKFLEKFFYFSIFYE